MIARDADYGRRCASTTVRSSADGSRAGSVAPTACEFVRTPNGHNFAFETTLAGLGYARMIDAWRVDGYRVKLMFLSPASADEAVARVAMRGVQI